MAQASNIEWTDATWPVVQGCDYDSPGCTNCYAPRQIWRQASNPNPKVSVPVQGLVDKTGAGKLVWTGKVALRDDRLRWPLKWKKPLKIFLPSHGDLFHEDVPDAFIDRVFGVMAATSRHTYQLLTKRSERMAEYAAGMKFDRLEAAAREIGYTLKFEGVSMASWPLPNVWLGVSVEDRARLPRIDHLRKTPAAVRFISFEPLLEDLGEIDLTGIHQAITGGESGPRRRPHDVEWQRNILRQCRAQGVAFFGKQDDKVRPLPADLMIREFPTVAP